MEYDSLLAPNFAIVRFVSCITIIRRYWAIFNNKGEIVLSFYLKRDLKKLSNRKGDFVPTKDAMLRKILGLFNTLKIHVSKMFVKKIENISNRICNILLWDHYYFYQYFF